MAQYNDYGRWAAARRAKTKAQRDKERAGKASASQRRQKKNAPTVDEFPMRHYEAAGTQRHIDWDNATTCSAASHIANALDHEKMQLLSMPTGTGKTAVAVASLGRMQEELDCILPFIVAAPRAVIDQRGWHETIASWNASHPDNVLDPWLIDTHDRLANILDHPTSAAQLVSAMGAHGVYVLDEVHGYKNPTSKRSKKLQKTPHLRKLGLSATPFTNDRIMDSASYLIMAGFYRNKTDFINSNCLQCFFDDFGRLQIFDDNGRVLPVLWPDYGKFQEQLARILYRPSVDISVIGVPEVRGHLVQLEHSDELDADMRSLAKAYRDRMFDSVTDVRLAQIERLNGDALRLEKLIEIVTAACVVQPLVFYWHNVTREAIERAFESAGLRWQTISGGNAVADVDFDDDGPLLVQYQSGSEGIEMKHSNCAVFYENPSSYVKLEQARGRNVRRGMDHVVEHWHLVADDPFDRELFERMERREELDTEMLDEITRMALGIS